jgi:hypothetical protein
MQLGFEANLGPVGFGMGVQGSIDSPCGNHHNNCCHH